MLCVKWLLRHSVYRSLTFNFIFVFIKNYATFFRMLKLGYSRCTSCLKSIIIFCFISSCLSLTFFSNSGSSEVLLLFAEGYETVGNIDTKPCTNLELTGHWIVISTIVFNSIRFSLWLWRSVFMLPFSLNHLALLPVIPRYSQTFSGVENGHHLLFPV